MSSPNDSPTVIDRQSFEMQHDCFAISYIQPMLPGHWSGLLHFHRSNVAQIHSIYEAIPPFKRREEEKG